MIIILTVFYALIIAFIMAAIAIFVPSFRGRENFLFLAIPGIAIFVLGIMLVILAKRKKLEKKLKKYLILTGASAFGIFAGSILHNVFYALAMISEKIKVISFLMEILHGAFFIISILICPIGVIVGAVAANILLIKKCSRKKR